MNRILRSPVNWQIQTPSVIFIFSEQISQSGTRIVICRSKSQSRTHTTATYFWKQNKSFEILNFIFWKSSRFIFYVEFFWITSSYLSVLQRASSGQLATFLEQQVVSTDHSRQGQPLCSQSFITWAAWVRFNCFQKTTAHVIDIWNPKIINQTKLKKLT